MRNVCKMSRDREQYMSGCIDVSLQNVCSSRSGTSIRLAKRVFPSISWLLIGPSPNLTDPTYGSFRLAQNSRCLKLSSDGVTQKSGKMVSCQDPRHDVFHRVTESHETSATNGISRHFQETLTIPLTSGLALIEFTCESVEDHTHRLDYTPRHTEIRRTKPDTTSFPAYHLLVSSKSPSTASADTFLAAS